MTNKENDYRPYPLQELDMSIRNTMESECTPQEIYDTVINGIKQSMRYHKACYDDSVRLLALFRANSNPNIQVHYTGSDNNSTYTEKDYWEGKLEGKDFQQALEKYGYEYTPGYDTTKFKLDSPDLHGDDQ